MNIFSLSNDTGASTQHQTIHMSDTQYLTCIHEHIQDDNTIQATKNTKTGNKSIPQVTGMEGHQITKQVAEYFNNHYDIEDSIPHVEHHMLHHFDPPEP